MDFSSHTEGSSDISSDILQFLASLYGPQLVLLATLSAITFFRREISCNHCYAEDTHSSPSDNGCETLNDTSNNNRTSPEPKEEILSWNPEDFEEILNGAGLYCSGVPLNALIMAASRLLFGTESAPSSPTSSSFFHPYYSSSNTPTSSSNKLRRTFPNEESLPRLAASASLLSENSHSDISELSLKRPRVRHSSLSATSSEASSLFESILPGDATVQILSFLHPKDVIRFGCTNKACNAIVEEPSSLLWKTLWYRDYGWLLHSWTVGVQARKRSRLQEALAYNKEFYFRFNLTYLEYVLAGQNSINRCMVGLSGHVYDLSDFVTTHPGSPETILVMSGMDATQLFARIRHSRGARKLAQSMCILVDGSRIKSKKNDSSTVDSSFFGIRPTHKLAESPVEGSPNNSSWLLSPDDSPSSSGSDIPAAMDPLTEDDFEVWRSSASESSSSTAAPRGLQNLWHVYQRVQRERQAMQQKAESKFRNGRRSGQLVPALGGSLGDSSQCHLYYDPLDGEWKAWYMAHDLSNVFFDLD